MGDRGGMGGATGGKGPRKGELPGSLCALPS